MSLDKKRRGRGLETKRVIPKEGFRYSASEGNVLTRVHLEAVEDGIALALVGAASSALQAGNRHVLSLERAGEGITLSLVGAASASAL